jgi:FKBP-type peptidyl-prolyl cis-trans isomerase FkpA
MNNRPYMRPVPLLAASVISLLPLTMLAEETVEPTPQDNSAAFQAMGFAMASQLRLNIGFSEEELDAIFAGMTIAATGGTEPEGFKDNIQQAQQIYMTRMQDFQAAEQERAKVIAEGNKAEAADFFATIEGKEGIKKTETGLYYEMIQEGTGKSPGETDRVKVNYKGVLVDGTEFDGNDNADFVVNRVVPGFSEGLQLLKEGGKIKLYIPSELGYGDRPARPGSVIEPGDALVFDVELLEVVPMPAPPTSGPPALPKNLKRPPAPPTGARPAGPPGPPPSGPPPGPPPSSPPPGPPPSAPPTKG